MKPRSQIIKPIYSGVILGTYTLLNDMRSFIIIIVVLFYKTVINIPLYFNLFYLFIMYRNDIKLYFGFQYMYCLPAICLMKCFTETEIKLYENEYTKAYLIHCGDVYANMYQI